MSEKIADVARNKWKSLLPALGVKAEFLTGRHGPCPMCGGTDRFRFDDKNGTGSFFCNACGAGDGAALAMGVTGQSFADVARRVRELAGHVSAGKPQPSMSAEDTIARMRKLWKSANPLAGGDMAVRYLANRGIGGPFVGDLRFAADCRVQDHPKKTRLSAMLALVRAPDGSVTSLHRTYLEDGAKAKMANPRKVMAGTIAKGSAIRLASYAGILGVAEGIETALAVMRDFGIPCWSTLNSGMMREFQWPDDITELRIFGDNDPKFGGQAAAFQLAHRAMTARHPVRASVYIPEAVGTDWATLKCIANAA